MLIDSHLHLEQFDDIDSVYAEAVEAGVAGFVCVSQERESMVQVLQLKERFPKSVWTALGIHPVEVTRLSDEELENALGFMADHLDGADEVGEVGLDYKWADTPSAQQRQTEILTRQLDLAARYGKPVNLHSRRCQRQVMERAITFQRDTGLNAQLHWFTQSSKLVSICNDEGIFVSVGPTVLDQKQTQDVAITISDELLLLETDAPVPIGGEIGHPRRLCEVAAKLAELKGVSMAYITDLTAANFARFLSR